MINLPFNPFDCEFDKLEPRHLGRLHNVAEGWFVEYKRELVNPKSIAKSLAAFANHYGGWIFYGVQEADDGRNVAQYFPGIEQEDAYKLIEDLRNAARDIVTPAPFFEYKKLDGPCNDIGLPDGRSVVVVRVPIGPDAPYVHNDGRIYRRIADSSEPKPETDRFVLDNLWNRRQTARAKLQAFLESNPMLEFEEEDASYLDIFLLPDPLGLGGQRVKMSFEDFVKFLSTPTIPETQMYMEFDNFFPMADGMIARHIFTNDPDKVNLTWRFYSNGSSVITIPFSSTLASDLRRGGWLHGYYQESAFVDRLSEGHYDDCVVLDVNQLFLLIGAIMGQNRQLLMESGIRGSYYAKAVLHNVGKRIPFVDTDMYMNFIKKCGIPVIQFSEEYAPPGKDFDTLLQLPDLGVQSPLSNTQSADSQANNDPFREKWLNDLSILANIINGLGLRHAVFFDEIESQKVENSFFSTAKRCADVNKWRSQLNG